MALPNTATRKEMMMSSKPDVVRQPPKIKSIEAKDGRKQPSITQYFSQFSDVLLQKFGLIMESNERSAFNEILSKTCGKLREVLDHKKEVYYKNIKKLMIGLENDKWLVDDGEIIQTFNGIDIPKRAKWPGMHSQFWLCYRNGIELEVYTENGEKVSLPDLNMSTKLKLARHHDGMFTVMRENRILQPYTPEDDEATLVQHGNSSIPPNSGVKESNMRSSEPSDATGHQKFKFIPYTPPDDESFVYMGNGKFVSVSGQNSASSLKLVRNDDGTFSIILEKSDKGTTVGDDETFVQQGSSSHPNSEIRTSRKRLSEPNNLDAIKKLKKNVNKAPEDGCKMLSTTQRADLFETFGLTMANNERYSFDELMSKTYGVSHDELEREKTFVEEIRAANRVELDNEEWFLDNGLIKKKLRGVDLPKSAKWPEMHYHFWVCLGKGIKLVVYTYEGDKVSAPDIELATTLKLARFEDGKFSVLIEKSDKGTTTKDASMMSSEPIDLRGQQRREFIPYTTDDEAVPYSSNGEKVSITNLSLAEKPEVARDDDKMSSALREKTNNAQPNGDDNILFQHGSSSRQNSKGKVSSKKGRKQTNVITRKKASKGNAGVKSGVVEKKVKIKRSFVSWNRDTTEMFKKKYEEHWHAQNFKIREFAKIFIPLGFTFYQVDAKWKRMYPGDVNEQCRWPDSADVLLKQLRLKYQHPMYMRTGGPSHYISNEGWKLLTNEFNKHSQMLPKPVKHVRDRCVKLKIIEANKLKAKLKRERHSMTKEEKVDDKWDNNAVPICALEMEYKGTTRLVQAAYTASGESGRVLTVPYNEAEHGIKITIASHRSVYEHYKKIFGKSCYSSGYRNVQFEGYVPLENMNRLDLLASVQRRIDSKRHYRYDQNLDKIVQPDGTTILGTKMYKNRMYCISEKDNRQSATRIVGEYDNRKHGQLIDSRDSALYEQLNYRIQTYGEYKNVPFVLLAELAKDYGHVHVWISEMKQHFDRNEKYSHLSKKEKDILWLMERGRLLEPVLLQLYNREQDNGNMQLDTRQVLYSIVNPRGGEKLSCKPDGTVGDVGCVEGKAPGNSIEFNAIKLIGHCSKLVRLATPEEIRLGSHGNFLCNSWEDNNVYHLQEGTEVEKQIARHLFIGGFEWCDLVYYYQDDMNSKEMKELWVQRLYKKDLKKCWDKYYGKC